MKHNPIYIYPCLIQLSSLNMFEKTKLYSLRIPSGLYRTCSLATTHSSSFCRNSIANSKLAIPSACRSTLRKFSLKFYTNTNLGKSQMGFQTSPLSFHALLRDVLVEDEKSKVLTLFCCQMTFYDLRNGLLSLGECHVTKVKHIHEKPCPNGTEILSSVQKLVRNFAPSLLNKVAYFFPK